jgi:hypothetical protein
MPYNVILFTDIPNPDHFTRGYGAYRLASEIRKHGYTVLTVDFSSALDEETFTKIISAGVDQTTLAVGFSTTWFPYIKKEVNSKYIIGQKSRTIDSTTDFNQDAHLWYRTSLTNRIAGGELSVFAKIIKDKNPKTKVIIGGAKSSEYISDPSADNVFIGYSENQIVDYLNSISGQGPKRIFNKVIDYDAKAVIGDFDIRTGITEYVETDIILPEELLTFEFSRGCIFNCTFCSMAHRNQDTRDFVKYKETIKKELMDNWSKWGIYKYTITDDTFNDYTEKLELINDVIQELPFTPVFSWAYARVDLIGKNPEQAQLLKDIGIKEVYYGLETWNDTTAKAIRKGGSRSRKIESMKIAKECWGDDIILSAGIVIGLPYDTVDSVNEVVDWYIEEGHKIIDNLKFVTLTIFPDDGTNNYKFLSDIETDPAAYNYSFPDPVNRPYHWVRDDSGDIKDKDQAFELMIAANKKVKPYYNQNQRGSWDNFKYYVTGGNAAEMYYKFVTEKYFPKLIKILCSN